MACILAIETSGSYCSVSISDEKTEWYGATFFLPQIHAKALAPLIEKAMLLSEKSWDEIDAVAVGSGPGSYTGLRIAVSMAKGICFGQSKPLIAVGTMENLAVQGFEKYPQTERILVALEARRDEVYAAILDRQLNFIMPTQAIVLGDFHPEPLLDHFNVLLLGDGTPKTSAFFGNPTAWKQDLEIFPDARSVAKVALRKPLEVQYEDLIQFEPDYIKPVFITVAK